MYTWNNCRDVNIAKRYCVRELGTIIGPMSPFKCKLLISFCLKWSGVYLIFCSHETFKCFSVKNSFVSPENIISQQPLMQSVLRSRTDILVTTYANYFWMELCSRENNLWYKTRCQTTIICHFTYWTRPKIINSDEQHTFVCCVHHNGIFNFIFTFLMHVSFYYLYYQWFVNWSDSLTDVVYVLFFRDSLCQYFTAFLMGRWVNDECNFMDGQNWEMTINIQALSTAISPRHPICSLTSKSIIMWEAIYTDSLTHKHQEKQSYLLAPCKLLSFNVYYL